MRFIKNLLSRIWHSELQKHPRQYYESLLPAFGKIQNISLKVHQVCIGDPRALPQEIQENISQLRKRNEDCEFKLWEEQDIKGFIQRVYGETILNDYYLRINPLYAAARADFFRYLLIYSEGGMYLDLKSSLNVPLKELASLGSSVILSHWDNEEGEMHEGYGLMRSLSHIPKGEYIQWFLCSAPGSPLLRAVILRVMECIDLYNPFTVGVAQQGVISTTGPLPYSLAIQEVLDAIPELRHECYIANSCKDLGLVYSIYEGVSGSPNGEHKRSLKTNYNARIAPVIQPRHRLPRAFYAVYGWLQARYAACLVLMRSWGIVKPSGIDL